MRGAVVSTLDGRVGYGIAGLISDGDETGVGDWATDDGETIDGEGEAVNHWAGGDR
ncbi:MAG: hypothetical protein HC772_06855 [Leptolyngbyaceae cyanobacterium CRU_2_3]|nr:hypothetical protein [Leptolyngbyaceae cyanobacterium CRU_2_3]